MPPLWYRCAALNPCRFTLVAHPLSPHPLSAQDQSLHPLPPDCRVDLLLGGQMPHPNKQPGDRQAMLCAQALMAELEKGLFTHDFFAPQNGKMFGVLVVQTPEKVGYLRAVSGMLAGEWELPGFAPPVFDLSERLSFLAKEEAKTKEIEAELHRRKEILDSALKEFEELKQSLAREKQAFQEELRRRKAARREKRHRLQIEGGEPSALLALLEEESRRDKREKRSLNASHEARLKPLRESRSAYQDHLREMNRNFQEHCNRLLDKIFAGYSFLNHKKEGKNLSQLFGKTQAPAGSGDCCAPKLLQSCFDKGYRPLALVEFWWGSPPKGSVRHHKQFYPPCQSKCAPILAHQLADISQPPPKITQKSSETLLSTALYEDNSIAVFDKPSGLLSVPGKISSDSALEQFEKKYPKATGPLIAHRLDMDTSGLLIFAKDSETHTNLQKQFEARLVKKFYLAWLEGIVPEDEGSVDFSLAPDYGDRPRQIYSEEGKEAITKYRVIKRIGGFTKILFSPLTGRTHQLRVHSSHFRGLNTPIVGDRLYGKAGSHNLLLHASSIAFRHPASNERVKVTAKLPPRFVAFEASLSEAR